MIIPTYLNPATGSVVWNFKIVIVAVLFRLFLNRILSNKQWFAVLVLF